MLKTIDGVIYDDIVKDEDGNEWAEICNSCITKYNIPSHLTKDNASDSIICGVQGCNHIAEKYIDFNNA